MQIQNGHYFSEREIDRKQKVAVLGASLAKELFGETTTVRQVISVGNTKLTVVGVFSEKGMIGNADFDSQLYIPITVVFDKFLPTQMARIMGDRVRMIYVEIEDQEVIDDVILQTVLLLSRRHKVSLDEPDFVITTQQDIIDTRESTTAAFRNLLAWVASVSLLVGGFEYLTPEQRETAIAERGGHSGFNLGLNDVLLEATIELLESKSE